MWETYLYGPDLVVRPVWEPEAGSVSVHIPPGMWRDLWTGEEVVGPTVVEVPVPLHVVPAYARVESGVEGLDLPARWVEAQERARARPDLEALLRGEGW